MTEVLHSPSSSSSPSISTPTHNAALFHQTTQSFVGDEAISMLTVGDAEERQEENSVREKRENDRREQLSILALLVDLFRKSFWLTCKTGRENFAGTSAGGVMEISWPTDVEHVNHVTFDRFDGFLGLPVEFEPEVLRRAPSASATVFGVSTESMQLSYDQRGNSIPTILLLMQRHLYSRGGLQVEGIFRITAGNSQEEYVRDHLNRGVVPDGIDVHCLGGLIKAWFRELPTGVLDSLSSEQVMQCQSEEDCAALVRLLPPTEAALLDWVINLMADVVQEEHRNKMNARNIAMVFAPNMTQMADPLTALMYAVQVMNFLKTLIEKTLREREEPLLEPAPVFDTEHHPDDNGHQSFLHKENPQNANEQQPVDATFVVEHPETADSASETNQVDHNVTDEDSLSCYSTSAEESDANGACGTPSQVYRVSSPSEAEVTKDFQNLLPNPSKFEQMKNKGVSNVTRINSVTERYESLW